MAYAGIETNSFDRYRASLSGISALAADRERELARACAQGDERAGRKLIEANLPFVIRIARKYHRWGVPIEDLVQQGNLGLLKAAKRFDPDKNCRLSTYASFWIRAEIREYVVRVYRIVRLGSTRTERKAMRSFRTEKIDSPEELARISGMPEARAQQLFALMQKSDVALDAPLYGGGNALERMPSDEIDPERCTIDQAHRVRVEKGVTDALATLSVRENSILRQRVLAEEPCTLQDIGRQMGISKERVRQLESRAYRKLQTLLTDFAPAA